jgi:hypothetical protein
MLKSTESHRNRDERHNKLFSLIFDCIFLLLSIICIIVACFVLKKYIRRKVSNIALKIENFQLSQEGTSNNLTNHDLI